MNNKYSELQFIFSFCFQLFETSAQDETECDNVEAIFLTLAHKIKNHRPMMPVPPMSFHGNDSNQSLSRADVISVTRRSQPSSARSIADDSGNCFC
jgi:Ras-related protein Rab-33B